MQPHKDFVLDRSHDQVDFEDLEPLEPLMESPMTPLVGFLSFGTRLHLSPTFSGHLLETAAAAQTTRPSSEGGGVLEDPRVRSQSVPVEPAEGEPSGSGGQKARERNKRAQRTFRQRQKVSRSRWCQPFSPQDVEYPSWATIL